MRYIYLTICRYVNSSMLIKKKLNNLNNSFTICTMPVWSTSFDFTTYDLLFHLFVHLHIKKKHKEINIIIVNNCTYSCI